MAETVPVDEANAEVGRLREVIWEAANELSAPVHTWEPDPWYEHRLSDVAQTLREALEARPA